MKIASKLVLGLAISFIICTVIVGYQQKNIDYNIKSNSDSIKIYINGFCDSIKNYHKKINDSLN